MLLTETINNSISAIQRKRTAQENKQSAEAYASALAKLNSASDKLKTTLKCASALKERGIVNQPLMTAQTRDSLIECTNNCGKGLYDGTLTSDMVAVLKTKSESFSDQIQNAWSGAAAKYASGTCGYLTIICNLTEDPLKSRALIDSINKKTASGLSVKSIDDLITDVEQARKITKSFALNPTIEAFLKKVSLQQATLCDLTPEIYAWLQEKQVENKIKIRF